jgi:SAM-dependent methyltransferase
MAHDLHEQNRRSWNHATIAHESHKRGQAAWIAGGGTTLFPEELELLGDLRGKRVVHLQCNSGADTVCLAARGAQVTGVDISDQAIAAARRLSDEAGIAVELERADVFDWFDATADAGRQFDVAFASYGALPWVSDLRAWMRGVAGVLGAGGRLVVVEFHPDLYLLEEQGDGWGFAPLRGFGGRRWDQPGIGDYVAASGTALAPSGFHDGDVEFDNPEPCHEFEWSVGDVVDAIAGAGLVVEALREWPYSNGCRFFSSMVDLGERRWGLPEGAPRIPLMYGAAACWPW